MPDERLRIVIEAVDKASAELKGLKKDLEGVGAAGQIADKNIVSTTAALTKIAGVAGTAAVGLKKLYDIGKEGASLDRIQNSFVAISGSAEDAANNLEILREATRGAKSDMELMEGATNILALGLADSSEQLGAIVRNVEGLGARFGGTMQIFQLMMSNQSLMRVDSFGLGVEEVTKRIDELKEAGMEADKAFNTAVLELMTEKYEELGGALEDNALAYEQLEANIKNITDAFKMQASEAVSPLVAKYSEFVSKTLESDQSLLGFGATIRMINSLIGNETIPIYEQYGIKAKEGTTATGALTGSMYDLSASAMQTAGSVNTLKNSINDIPSYRKILI